MNMEELLKRRFTEAIRKSFDPCPLIGPKWFCYRPAARCPRFEFVGISKLAKAVAVKPSVLSKRILRNLDVKGIPGEVKVVAGYDIHVILKKDAIEGGDGK